MVVRITHNLCNIRYKGVLFNVTYVRDSDRVVSLPWVVSTPQGEGTLTPLIDRIRLIKRILSIKPFTGPEQMVQKHVELFPLDTCQDR